MAHRLRTAALPWTRLSDEELLKVRLCDLRVSVERSSLKPHIRRLFDAFGPRRCHWGTDLTNSFAKATYKQRITHFTETLEFLSPEDKEWIMGRAILERLGWSNPAA